jgi:hypothetical protein
MNKRIRTAAWIVGSLLFAGIILVDFMFIYYPANNRMGQIASEGMNRVSHV